MPRLIAWTLARAAVVVALTAAAVSAQRPVPVIVLDKGATELSDPFNRISGLVEIADGRVLVSEQQEREVWLADFARDTRTQVARSGGGPTEIQFGVLVPGASDSAIYFDVQQRRLVVFSPAGIPLFTRTLGGDRSDPMSLLTGLQPRYVDASGRVIGQTSGVKIPVPKPGSTNIGDMMPAFADSVFIVRLDPVSGKTDTIAQVRNVVAASAPKMTMEGAAMKFTLRAPGMQPIDAWTGLPDGRVAILRDGRYRVVFASAEGALKEGPAIPFTPIPLTAAEKKAAMDSIRGAMARMNQAIGRGIAAAGGDPSAARKVEYEVLEPVSWAAAKPPYDSGAASSTRRGWIRMT